MRKYLLSLLLLIICATAASGQYYSIRRSQLDSLIWVAQKGLVCDTLYKTQLKAITAIQISEGEKVRLIELQASQLENYRLLEENWSARLTNQAELSSIERQKLRNKVRKRGRIIFGESVGIGVLLVLLLL